RSSEVGRRTRRADWTGWPLGRSARARSGWVSRVCRRARDARCSGGVPSFSFEVSADEAGKRLDVALVRRLANLGRGGAKRLIEQGLVQVNGRKVRKGVVLARGDQVSLSALPEGSDFAAAPDPELELPLRHEDPAFVVVSKPAGVP